MNIFVDLDGTIQDSSHRVHLLKDKKWDEFHALSEEDTKIESGVEIMFTFFDRAEDYDIVFVTGRNERFRDITEKWIFDNLNEIAPHEYTLKMRDDGDYRPNEVLKEEWLQEYGSDRVLMAMDDNPKAVEMYRSHGVPCVYMPDIGMGINSGEK